MEIEEIKDFGTIEFEDEKFDNIEIEKEESFDTRFIIVKGKDGSQGGTYNYEELENKPQINNVELVNNKSLDDLNIQVKGNYANSRVTNIEIDNLFK